MANLNTDIYAADIGNIRQRSDGKLTSGKIMRLSAVYTCTGAEANNDVIRIADLPIDGIVIPALCNISSDGTGGTTPTIAKLGDAGDDDRYSATAVALTASFNRVTPAVPVSHTPFEITEATKTLQAVVGLADGAMTAGKKITFEIFYVIP